jgi:uncharacterized damage-inducible protein DinB
MSEKNELLASWARDLQTTRCVLRAYPADRSHQEFMHALRETPDGELRSLIGVPRRPGEMSDVPRSQLLWLALMHQIDHRGQLSVYLRLAGGKVPSIYGPSADEPWPDGANRPMAATEAA